MADKLEDSKQVAASDQVALSAQNDEEQAANANGVKLDCVGDKKNADNSKTESQAVSKGFVFGQQISERVKGVENADAKNNAPVPSISKPFTSDASNLFTNGAKLFGSGLGLGGLKKYCTNSPFDTKNEPKRNPLFSDDVIGGKLFGGLLKNMDPGLRISNADKKADDEQEKVESNEKPKAFESPDKNVISTLNANAEKYIEEVNANKTVIPEVESVTGEENEENVFEKTAKFFRFETPAGWKAKGRVITRLNDSKNGDSSRFIIRQGRTFRLWCNIAINRQLKPNIGHNGTGLNFWGQFEDSPAYLCVRLPTAEDCQTLYDLLKERIDKLEASQPIVSAASKRKSENTDEADGDSQTKKSAADDVDVKVDSPKRKRESSDEESDSSAKRELKKKGCEQRDVNEAEASKNSNADKQQTDIKNPPSTAQAENSNSAAKLATAAVKPNNDSSEGKSKAQVSAINQIPHDNPGDTTLAPDVKKLLEEQDCSDNNAIGGEPQK